MNALFGDVERGHLFVDMVRGLGFSVQGVLGKVAWGLGLRVFALEEWV